MVTNAITNWLIPIHPVSTVIAPKVASSPAPASTSGTSAATTVPSASSNTASATGNPTDSALATSACWTTARSWAIGEYPVNQACTSPGARAAAAAIASWVCAARSMRCAAVPSNPIVTSVAVRSAETCRLAAGSGGPVTALTPGWARTAASTASIVARYAGSSTVTRSAEKTITSCSARSPENSRCTISAARADSAPSTP